MLKGHLGPCLYHVSTWETQMVFLPSEDIFALLLSLNSSFEALYTHPARSARTSERLQCLVCGWISVVHCMQCSPSWAAVATTCLLSRERVVPFVFISLPCSNSLIVSLMFLFFLLFLFPRGEACAFFNKRKTPFKPLCAFFSLLVWEVLL